MKHLQTLLNDKVAKSNKSKIGIIITIAVIAVFGMTFFGGDGVFIGIIFGAIVLAAIVVGVYYWLKVVDDLPDALA